MKVGDKVRVIGIPTDTFDKDDMLTRTIFEKCLGRTFEIAELTTVEGLSHPLAMLNVGHVIGREPILEAIWVEPEFLELVE